MLHRARAGQIRVPPPETVEAAECKPPAAPPNAVRACNMEKVATASTANGSPLDWRCQFRTIKRPAYGHGRSPHQRLRTAPEGLSVFSSQGRRSNQTSCFGGRL